jgi:hypothetical protein
VDLDDDIAALEQALDEALKEVRERRWRRHKKVEQGGQPTVL